MRTGRADVDGDGERALDERQPLGEFVGGATQQEIGAVRPTPRATRGRAGGEQGAVEDLRRRGGGHGALCAARGARAKTRAFALGSPFP